MKANEKAAELYDKFSKYTHGYVGSSMLSNTEFEDEKANRTKAVVSLVIDEIESAGVWVGRECAEKESIDPACTEEYWKEVRLELALLTP